MSAPAVAGRPSLTIRGRQYPVLLPTIRDPRLHLAAVIITLQVLGQTAFDFDLSIAQILVSLGTLRRARGRRSRSSAHQVIMWPASALLTGNGVAFILRVPGTEHGDWWSMHGWWIFAGTAAIALLSKYVIRVDGRHVFNPSNFGLVVCFLALGKFAPIRSTSGGARCRRGWRWPLVRHRRRRVRDPAAAAAAGDRCRLLGHVRRRDGVARRERALDDRALARRADRGLGLLVARS